MWLQVCVKSLTQTVKVHYRRGCYLTLLRPPPHHHHHQSPRLKDSFPAVSSAIRRSRTTTHNKLLRTDLPGFVMMMMVEQYDVRVITCVGLCVCVCVSMVMHVFKCDVCMYEKPFSHHPLVALLPLHLDKPLTSPVSEAMIKNVPEIFLFEH